MISNTMLTSLKKEMKCEFDMITRLYRKIRILVVKPYIKLKIFLFKGKSFSSVRHDILLEENSELNIDMDLFLLF